MTDYKKAAGFFRTMLSNICYYRKVIPGKQFAEEPLAAQTWLNEKGRQMRKGVAWEFHRWHQTPSKGIINVDASVTQNGSGSLAFLHRDQNGVPEYCHQRNIGDTNSDKAETEGLQDAIDYIVKEKITKVRVLLDSRNAYWAILGKHKTKNMNWSLVNLCRELKLRQGIEFAFVKRDMNRTADWLASEAHQLDVGTTLVSKQCCDLALLSRCWRDKYTVVPKVIARTDGYIPPLMRLVEHEQMEILEQGILKALQSDSLHEITIKIARKETGGHLHAVTCESNKALESGSLRDITFKIAQHGSEYEKYRALIKYSPSGGISSTKVQPDRIMVMLVELMKNFKEIEAGSILSVDLVFTSPHLSSLEPPPHFESCRFKSSQKKSKPNSIYVHLGTTRIGSLEVALGAETEKAPFVDRSDIFHQQPLKLQHNEGDTELKWKIMTWISKRGPDTFEILDLLKEIQFPSTQNAKELLCKLAKAGIIKQEKPNRYRIQRVRLSELHDQQFKVSNGNWSNGSNKEKEEDKPEKLMWHWQIKMPTEPGPQEDEVSRGK